jgi:hypothetical protein
MWGTRVRFGFPIASRPATTWGTHSSQTVDSSSRRRFGLRVSRTTSITSIWNLENGCRRISHQIGGAPLPTHPTSASAVQPIYHSASTPNSIGGPPAAPQHSSNPFTSAPKFDVSRDPYNSEAGNFLGSGQQISHDPSKFSQLRPETFFSLLI